MRSAAQPVPGLSTIAHVDTRIAGRRGEFAGLTLALGVAGGAAVSLLAFLLARYGPADGSWSFRGNGALAAYTVVPALLAAGWTAVVIHERRLPWPGPALAAGLVGIVLAAFDAALLPALGAGADQTVGPVLLAALLAWTVIAPASATRIPRRTASRPVPAGVAVGAAAWLIGVVAGVIAVGFLLPAGS
jgi:hypothetical protein